MFPLNKILIIAPFSLFFVSVAQKNPQNFFVLPSPTAFELTKYGNIKVNESMGEISTSIPLYNFNSGKLSLPISLMYSGGGVKVDQLSSWTGINWNFLAGGVITRIVRDRPDEKGKRVFYDYRKFRDLLKTTEGVNTLKNIYSHSRIDSEVDIFKFNFLGFSGSFFLDENLNPNLCSYNKEIDIKFIDGFSDNDNQQIVITDDKGVKYFFGGMNGTERTRTNPGVSSPLTLDNPITSFFLVKIKNTLGDEIYFDYLREDSVYTLKLSILEHSYKRIALDGGARGNQTKSNVKKTQKNMVYDGLYLHKIRTNRTNEEIVLESNFINNNHISRVLKGFQVKESGGLFKHFKFTYKSKKSLENSSRFFLEKVQILNKKNKIGKEFSFEYNRLESMPERLSASKDHLGYYNGKSNSSYLPIKFVGDNYGTFMKSSSNREPSFIESIAGTLKRINYPTKGYTTFEYGAPESKRYLKKSVQLHVFKDLKNFDPETYPIPDTELIDAFFLDPDFNKKDSIYMDQSVKVKVGATTNSTKLSHHYKIKVEVINTTDPDPSNQTSQVEYLSLDTGQFTKQTEFDFSFLKGQHYIVKAELITPEGIITDSPIDAWVSFDFIKGIEMKDGLGVRIRKVNDYSKESILVNSKRYFYSKAIDIGVKSKIPFWNPSLGGAYFSYSSYTVGEASNGTVGGYDIKHYKEYRISSKPISVSIFPHSDSNYSYVTVSFGGDDFRGGGIQKKFESISKQSPFNPFNADIDRDFPFSSKENRDIYNGEILEELFLEKKNNIFFLRQKKNKEYTRSYDDFVNNIVVIKNYDPGILALFTDTSDDRERTRSIHHLSFGTYKTFVNKSNLTSQVLINYIDPVPISDIENESNYKQIKTTTNYSYKDNLVGVPVEVVTETSQGEVLKTKNYYPSDKNNITGLTDDEKLNLDILKLQHRVSEPIQTDVYKNDVLLSSQRTNYKSWDNNIVLPKEVETSKGAQPLEDRVVYHSYDDKGNPTDVSKKDGTHIVYIWGYHQTQLIAKIEGAKLSDIPTTYISNIQNASNLDNDRTMNYNGREGNLRKQLNKLHQLTALKKSQMTFYTYDPLIGVTSITDSRGETVYYEYDDFNRLEYVKDAQGNILKEHKYKYKNN